MTTWLVARNGSTHHEWVAVFDSLARAVVA
jgi:hypothetical protein